MDLIKSPVRYEAMGTMMFDANNNHILDIRGWGRLQYIKDGAAIQDSIGHFIADAINEKNEREGKANV